MLDVGSERLEGAFFHPDKSLTAKLFWYSFIDHTKRKVSL